MFIINPMITMANTQLGIEFEHVNILKIQNVWKASDAFAVILPQQRPVLVSSRDQNFFSWSLAKKTLQAHCTRPFYLVADICIPGQVWSGRCCIRECQKCSHRLNCSAATGCPVSIDQGDGYLRCRPKVPVTFTDPHSDIQKLFNLEGTLRYAGLLLVSAEGCGQGFYDIWTKKKKKIVRFLPILDHFNSNLNNFEKNPMMLFEINKIFKKLFKKILKIFKIQKQNKTKKTFISFCMMTIIRPCSSS